jgi:hypothetical protein
LYRWSVVDKLKIHSTRLPDPPNGPGSGHPPRAAMALTEPAQLASAEKDNAMTYWEQVEAACGAPPATAGAELEGKGGDDSLDMLFN